MKEVTVTVKDEYKANFVNTPLVSTGFNWQEDDEHIYVKQFGPINRYPKYMVNIEYKGNTRQSNEWVSVEEKPQPFVSLLVCDVNGVNSDEREPVKAYYEPDTNRYIAVNDFDYEEYKDVKVTHWQPLPEPPKED